MYLDTYSVSLWFCEFGPFHRPTKIALEAEALGLCHVAASSGTAWKTENVQDVLNCQLRKNPEILFDQLDRF